MNDYLLLFYIICYGFYGLFLVFLFRLFSMGIFSLTELIVFGLLSFLCTIALTIGLKDITK